MCVCAEFSLYMCRLSGKGSTQKSPAQMQCHLKPSSQCFLFVIVINIHVYTSLYTYAGASQRTIPKSPRACTCSAFLGSDKLFSKMVAAGCAPAPAEGCLPSWTTLSITHVHGFCLTAGCK